MTREEAKKEIKKVFVPAFANYIITALTEGATISDKEQEPTTSNDLGVDTVSRKAVHDMLENLPITVEDKWFNWLQKACMRLAELPSVTPQASSWIPVTERLPKKDGLYLVSVKNDHLRRYSKTCWYSDKNWFARQDVVAWQPLPESYKGGREDIPTLIKI